MAPPPPPPQPPRILFSGDARGCLKQLFKRVDSVSASTGPFNALLCVGQFFPDSDSGDLLDGLRDYLESRSLAPVPTYFVGDYGSGAARSLAGLSAGGGFKQDGIQLAHNLYWLRGSGKFSLHGLTVAYLSGRSSPDPEGRGKYSRDDVDALRALAEEKGVVDIFLTNEWPSGIANRADTSEAPAEVLDPSGCDPVVAELVREIKPRYHIAGTKGIYYAREPYSNEGAAHVTRFIGLATVANKARQKFIHAISPTPASIMASAEICLKPPNTTLAPFIVEQRTNNAREIIKGPVNNDTDLQYWRYDISQKRQKQGGVDGNKFCFKFTSTGSCSHGEKCNFRHDQDAREQYKRNVCFDFLNKGKCERGDDCRFTHSLTDGENDFSIGQHGSNNQGTSRQTPSNSCWFCLSSPFVESHLVLSIGENYYCALAKGPLVPDHVLLLPIEHCPNTLIMPSEAEEELQSYKNALFLYFKSKEKTVIFFEWIFQRSPHANIQGIPIPEGKASNAQRIFKFAAGKLGFEFKETKQSDHRKHLKSQFDGKSNLFYVELPGGTILSHAVDEQENFQVEFGREVLAGLLKVPDRASWRNCKLSKEEETEMAECFKEGFLKFDPTG